jgi:diacylglycerol kinase family enzyme
MTNIFNPGFDAKVTAELDRRSKMPDSWKYKKYAYINLELTGNPQPTFVWKMQL